MDNLPQKPIIGIDVSRDWLDIYCLPDGAELRIANTIEGHIELTKLAQTRQASVCFEATGGLEWRLWERLDAAGIVARQLPPAQIKAFARSCGKGAKTDRIDAQLIARFMAFRPDAGRVLPEEKLRILSALTTKRAQLVETRKRLNVQQKAAQKQGVDGLFSEMDHEIKALLDKQITKVEREIQAAIAPEKELNEKSQILRSIPGVGFITSATLIAQMPELGQISGQQAAALTGLAPVTRASGQWQGKSFITGGRKEIRNVLYQAALVASIHNPTIKAFADRLKAAGKTHKLVITACARKLITIANAMCKSKQKWQHNL